MPCAARTDKPRAEPDPQDVLDPVHSHSQGDHDALLFHDDAVEHQDAEVREDS
jgi:hypothetical protein